MFALHFALLVGAAAAPIFRFRTDEFWLNLHQFLYVLGRAEAKAFDASREAVVHAPEDAERRLSRATDAERQVWHEAVSWYAQGLSRKEAVFDDPLPELANTLARAGDTPEMPRLARADSGLRPLLQRVAPVYRKLWWPEHRDANRRHREAMDSLVSQYGDTVLAFITRVYQMDWPEAGYPIHIAGYANWAGAFSTTGNLLIISSLDSLTRRLYGLESIFHEAMHQWDPGIDAILDEEAGKLGRRVPPSLSHAMIFFTAGEAIRRVAPEHVPYADAFGVWQRRWQPMREALVEIWKPYLDGSGTRDEAIVKLLERLTEP